MSARSSLRDLLVRQIREMPPARTLRFQLASDALERFGGARPLRILDAGCGEGLLTLALARRHPSWSVVGVDLSIDTLRAAGAEARRIGLKNVTFEHADLTADLGLEAYDAVAAMECLEEIPDDRAAIAAMAGALRRGGLLLADVPERDWAPVLPGSERTWRHEVRHGYSAGAITDLIEATGLTVTSVRATTRGTVRAAQELRDRIRHRSLRAQALAYPMIVAAVPLERWGLTWGRARALFVVARR
jgi:SAM-dependent methyltransferase